MMSTVWLFTPKLLSKFQILHLRLHRSTKPQTFQATGQTIKKQRGLIKKTTRTRRLNLQDCFSEQISIKNIFSRKNVI